ncbi:hypothetical protein KKG31_07755 [Patescibacteria group bacterium]|nr:hypothetical protein [Patescibacteria group bacterium]MBU1758960.1 hypothetical protein [Patescibacteria group bacterium]
MDDISEITKPNAVEVAKISQVANLNEKVLDFMISNVTFWNTMSDSLQEINSMTQTLKENIENSPKK